MDKDKLHFFSKELKKEASAFFDIMDTISNLDPASTAAAVTMAKINLMNRYGKNIPVVKDALGAHYKGMMHSGLMTGLRNERGTRELTRGLTAAVDSNTPGSYETGIALGDKLRQMGVTPDNLRERKGDIQKALKAVGSPIGLNEEAVAGVLDSKKGLNKIYDRLGQPVFGSKPSPNVKTLDNIDRLKAMGEEASRYLSSGFLV